MCQIEINGRMASATPGEMVLEVLRREGVSVPTLCNVEGLNPTGACRMCVVEVEGQGNLVPSCAFPVNDGMKIRTHSAKAIQARKTIVELLLSSHPDDCNYCARNSNCELQDLAAQLGVRQRRYLGKRKKMKVDVANPALVRDPDKCILCGRCVRVCEEIQEVGAIDFIGRGSEVTVGTSFDEGLNVSSCINCGQCLLVCPTGALVEKRNVEDVMNALGDPKKYVVVQHAPSVSVSLAEEFGVKPGMDIDKEMVAALRRLGFDRVFDTSFSADLTIMEEATELVGRLTNGGTLPMMTSCSPGWIKFVEQYYPEMIPHLSTCKSPQQMMGAIIKSFFAKREGLDPKDIVSVSVMPCTAKKFEAGRAEMIVDDVPDVDYVLTTRELGELIKMHGIDIEKLQGEEADNPFGERSSAGKLFGGSGGVMEAAVRTAYFLVTGNELDELKFSALRNSKGRKETTVKIGDLELGVAVVSGLANARKLLEEIKGGRSDIHFIEVMTCPGGCVAGGGQPINLSPDAVKARQKMLYKVDQDETLRTSHQNMSVQRLYKEFLGKPNGEKTHHLLHTKYVARPDVLK